MLSVEMLSVVYPQHLDFNARLCVVMLSAFILNVAAPFGWTYWSKSYSNKTGES